MIARRSIILIAILSLTACNQLGGQGRGSGNSVFELLSPPSPAEAARWAVDPNSPDNRQQGILLLANAPFGGESVYMELYRIGLEDQDAAVRAAAVRAFGLHGGPPEAELVLPLLRPSEDTLVRREAARTLARIHLPAAVPSLAAATDRTQEPDAEVRALAAEALGQHREPRVVQALIGALPDTRLLVGDAARTSLTTLTGEDFGYEPEPWLRWAASTQDLFENAKPFYYTVYKREPDHQVQLSPGSNHQTRSPPPPQACPSKPQADNPATGRRRCDTRFNPTTTSPLNQQIRRHPRRASTSSAAPSLPSPRRTSSIPPPPAPPAAPSSASVIQTKHASSPHQTPPAAPAPAADQASARTANHAPPRDPAPPCALTAALILTDRQMVKVPGHVTDDAAILAPLAAIALQAAGRLHIREKPYATIIGAGAEAVLTAQALALASATVRVLSSSEPTLVACEKRGVKSRPTDDAGRRSDQDIVVVCPGEPAALETALEMTAPRGRIIITPGAATGAADFTLASAHEFDILGSRWAPIAEGLTAIADGRLDPAGLLTKRVKLERAADAIAGAQHRQRARRRR